MPRPSTQGLDQLSNVILESWQSEGKTVFSGEDAFKLYDTFGFPIDLTREMCEERGITVDEEGFKALMEKQRSTAREATARNVGDCGLGRGCPERCQVPAHRRSSATRA